MLKLSRSRVISDIEFIVDRPAATRGHGKWISKGAECSIVRHSFTGEVYSFNVEVLQIRAPATGRVNWKLVIVSEFWRGSDAESIRATKWLKLLVGKPTDLLKWVSEHRATASPVSDEDLSADS